MAKKFSSTSSSSTDADGCGCLQLILFLGIAFWLSPTLGLIIIAIISFLAFMAALPWMLKILFQFTLWIFKLLFGIIVAVLGVVVTLYEANHNKKQLKIQKINKQISKLQDVIKNLHLEYTETNSYFENEDFQHYMQSSQFFLSKIIKLQTELDKFKDNLSTDYYNQTKQKFLDYHTDINKKIGKIKQLEIEQELSEKETHLKNIAPELWASYQQIKRDDATIREKIKTASNPAELTALHESNMQRFDSILQGYLSIKQSPKDYYDAEQRLQTAKEAIEQFDKDLDETLRQLNEAAMHDFEVNLRLMKEGKDHVEN